MKCPVDGCEKQISRGRKTCEAHYMRMRRNGSYEKKPRNPRKISFTVTETGCFEVDSHIPYTRGYFVTRSNGVRKGIHRHIYEECFGEIPEGWYVCHKCDNKRCINPEHLEVGPHEKNVRDAVERGRIRVGSNHPNANLTDEKVREIKLLLQQGVKNIELAKMFGAHRDTISDIKRGKSWKHVVV